MVLRQMNLKSIFDQTQYQSEFDLKVQSQA